LQHSFQEELKILVLNFSDPWCQLFLKVTYFDCFLKALIEADLKENNSKGPNIASEVFTVAFFNFGSGVDIAIRKNNRP
jgi:hypothetical protein